MLSLIGGLVVVLFAAVVLFALWTRYGGWFVAKWKDLWPPK